MPLAPFIHSPAAQWFAENNLCIILLCIDDNNTKGRLVVASRPFTQIFA
jgi:hypothetical protein